MRSPFRHHAPRAVEFLRCRLAPAYLGYIFGFPSFYDYKKQFYGLGLFDWKGNWIKANRTA